MFSAIFGFFLIITGLIYYFFPPKKKNSIYGYRTRLSMKSEDSFAFANKLASEYFLGVAFGTMLVSVIGNLYFSELASSIAAYVAFLIFVILLFFGVENQLKTHFDEEGRPLN